MKAGTGQLMAKKSRRHGKDVEYERGIIRELKSEIKNLKQRIKQLQRLEYNYTQSKNQPRYIPETPKEKLVICSNCKSDYLEARIVAGRTFDSCPSCKYRSKATKISNIEE